MTFIIFMSLVALAPQSAAASAPSTQITANTGNALDPKSITPSEIKARPLPIAGFDGDAAYVRSIAEKVVELSTEADQTDDPRMRVESLLTAANLILAQEIEPYCTRKFLRLEPAGDALPEAGAIESLDRADSLLGKVEINIKELRDAPEPDREWLADAGHRAETLAALAASLSAYLRPEAGDEGVRQARRAASLLSPLLEDSRKGVSASAAFWQATLRSADVDPSAALAVLEPALAAPPGDSMPYAFFGRLLRCQLIARRGGNGAAIALLTQMEERCGDWLGDPQGREAAVRTAQLVQIQILSGWRDRLHAIDDAEERGWCEARMNQLLSDRFGKDDAVVLRLSPSVPVLTAP